MSCTRQQDRHALGEDPRSHGAPALAVTTVSCMKQWVTELETLNRKAQRER
jgi:hypothetical protein